MYILKNAYLNIIRSKGRNILIGIIITVISIGCCVAITINKSGTSLVETYKENNPLEISLNLNAMDYRNASEEQKENFDFITVDQINQIGQLNTVVGYYYTLQSSLNSDDISSISYDDLFVKPSKRGESQEGNSSNKTMPSDMKMPNMQGTNGDFTVIAYSDISYNEDFISGNKKIIEGSMIDKDNTADEIVISQELATENELSVGDIITFKNVNDDSLTYELKIIGIYQIVNEEDNMNKMNNSSNQIYTNISVLNKIIEDNEVDTLSYSMASSISEKFYIKSEDLDKFKESLTDIGISEYYQIVTNEEEVNSSIQPIESISNFSVTFLIVILIVGGIVLTIINLFNIRERKYEIGVLRAIGMTKTKVTVQLVCEIFMISLVALIIGTGIGTILSQPVSNYMLKNEIESLQTKENNISENFGGDNFQRPGFGMNNMKGQQAEIKQVNFIDTLNVHTDLLTILELFGISILLTIVSGTVAVMFVNKYEPNKILQNRG